MCKSYWKAWQEFEVRHGNEDTFREMLRIKRSVQAQYNTQVNFMSAQMLAAATKEVQVTGDCHRHSHLVLLTLFSGHVGGENSPKWPGNKVDPFLSFERVCGVGRWAYTCISVHHEQSLPLC